MTTAAAERFQGDQSRRVKDTLVRYGITVGGAMVLVTLLLIFLYLLYVVAPTFSGARVSTLAQLEHQIDGQTLKLGTDENSAWAYRFVDTGSVELYSLTGAEHQTYQLPLSKQASITVSALSQPSAQTVALGLSDGQVMIVQPSFAVSYPDDVRTVTPGFDYPLNQSLFQLDPAGRPISQLSFEVSEESASIVWGVKGAQELTLTRLSAELDFLTDETVWSRENLPLPISVDGIEKILMTPDQRQLFVWSNNQVAVWQLDNGQPELRQTLDLSGSNIADIALLAGASSLLVATNDGVVSQWFTVETEGKRAYQAIRQFELSQPISSLSTEFFRKSFVAGTVDGQLHLLYTTSEKQLLSQSVSDAAIDMMAFSPRSNRLLVEDGNKLLVLNVSNPHPEVSIKAQWGKIWYEGYPEPAHVWQSSSGSDDFEPKLGLTPLVFGTVKAALYAMLFAIPIGIAGAVYTAYFMSSKVRGFVKPTIEIMEALPTVILGFLAGLWLAPIIEGNLPGLIAMIIMLPLAILLSSLCWQVLPEDWKNHWLQDYRELLLIPVLILAAWIALALSPLLEQWLMGGDARYFLTNNLGIGFDQRNALVVGVAMGFAVIPTIFSISEDAVFSVPRHLVNGSLALGATQWQTLTRVVIQTASPGIFSAVMMGFGRAVGETMIVLMATGNTPLMEWNVFEGMRTLAANIAIEMPESAVDSTHYRVLFLTAFVLFLFTFFFNSVAEFVRQRLRDKYSSL